MQTREIISRADARARGLLRYFTGKPCMRGHVDERTVSKAGCLACKRDEYARNKDTYSASSRARYKENSDAIKAYQKEYARKNPEKIRQRKREYHQENREKHLEYFRKRYAEIRADIPKKPKRTKDEIAMYQRDYRQRNKDRLADYVREYIASDRGRALALRRARKAAVKRATPQWLTQQQREDIVAKYRESARRTAETGIPHQVDHIVPLRGVTVCGLHVSWNLQVIPANDNRQKSNKFTA